MGFLKDFLGHRSARNLSKFILIFSAIAISTFAMIEIVSKTLNFELGIVLRNILAISVGIVVLLIKDDVLAPMKFFDRSLSKIAYSIVLAFIAIEISTIQFAFITELLDTTFLGFPLLAVRNIVALLLLFSVRNIHNNG